MNERMPKKEEPKIRQVPETWSTNRKIITEKEIKKIQEYVRKNKIGVDQFKIPGQPLTISELLKLIKI